jgi:anion-transporting  ArsA/GET3 family ATPase
VSAGLEQVILQKRILVCVGSGGVGKTTTAAALALEAARRGRKTLVLTIDPARRLANSLGLEALGHDVQEVPPTRLDAVGPRQPGGELYAMMLDQKRAFDEVVERHASDPEAVKRILANPIYAQISGSLAGAHEYAAMVKLEEFDRAGRFETIVVDTPPTAHALDFLDAPDKLTSAIDSPAIEWFRKLRAGGTAWRLMGRTGNLVLKALSRFVGSQFLEDMGVFLTEFNDILGGFRAHAEATFSLLRQPKVGFVLVSSPEPMAAREARYFHERLMSSGMPFSGFVINKVHADLPLRSGNPAAGDAAPAGTAPGETSGTPSGSPSGGAVGPGRAEFERALAACPPVAELHFQPSTLHLALEELGASHRDLQALARADREAIDTLRACCAQNDPLVEVPFFDEDIHDIERLGLLGQHLCQPERSPLARTA